MFICQTDCIDKYEGPAIDWAKAMPYSMSYGRCEFCGKTDGCYDVPSSAQWGPKKNSDSTN